MTNDWNIVQMPYCTWHYGHAQWPLEYGCIATDVWAQWQQECVAIEGRGRKTTICPATANNGRASQFIHVSHNSVFNEWSSFCLIVIDTWHEKWMIICCSRNKRWTRKYCIKGMVDAMSYMSYVEGGRWHSTPPRTSCSCRVTTRDILFTALGEHPFNWKHRPRVPPRCYFKYMGVGD